MILKLFKFAAICMLMVASFVSGAIIGPPLARYGVRVSACMREAARNASLPTTRPAVAMAER